MKTSILVAIIILFTRPFFAQLVSGTAIERNQTEEIIKHKIYLLENSLNEHNNKRYNSVVSAKVINGENKTVTLNANYRMLKVNAKKVMISGNTASVICNNKFYMNDGTISLEKDTVKLTKINREWVIDHVGKLVFPKNLSNVPGKNRRNEIASVWYNFVTPVISDRTFIQKAQYTNPNIYDINAGVTQNYLSRQLFGIGAEIDFTCYTNSVDPDHSGNSAVFSLDDKWNRIVYSRRGSNEIKSYGEHESDVKFYNPTAIDVNEFGEVFVLDNFTAKIHKFQYTYSSNTLIYIGELNIPGNILDSPFDLDYSNEWTGWDNTDDIILVTDSRRKSILKFNVNGVLLAESKYYNIDGVLYNIGYPTRISTNMPNNIQFIDASKNLVVSGYMSSNNELICGFLGKSSVSKLPSNYNPVDIGSDVSCNIIVADNMGLIHKFDYDCNYLCSYYDPLVPFGITSRISNSVRTYPEFVMLDINVNDRWSSTTGSKRLLPGADVIDLQVIDNGTYYEAECRVTDICYYKLEAINTNNEVIKTSEDTTIWGGEKIRLVLNKNEIAYGNYKFRVSVLPYFNQDYGIFAVGWKSREMTFQHSTNLLLSFNPVVWEGQSGTYYKNENTGEVSSQFQVLAGIPTTIKAYAPANCQFLSWSDGNVDNPRIFNLTENSSGLYAMFKILRNSTDTTAYSNCSQRKFMRTNYFPEDLEGTLHNVYESMGHVWHEISADNGLTWKVLHNGPVDEGAAPARSPSTAESNDLERLLFITYVKNNSVNVKIMKYGIEDVIDKQTLTLSTEQGPADPVITYLTNEKCIVVIWKTPSGLRYALANREDIPPLPLAAPDSTGNNWVPFNWFSDNPVPNTDSASFTPSIAGDSIAYIVWSQKGVSYYSYIYYCTASLNNGTELRFNDYKNISYGNGTLNNNYSPTIIKLNGGARACWVGRMRTTTFSQAVFKDPNNSQFWNMGAPVRSVSFGPTKDGKYIIGWSRTNGSSYLNNYTTNTSLGSVIKQFTTYGKDLQLCNGPDIMYVKANAFNINPGTLNYFTLSQAAGQYSKENAGTSLESSMGRQAVIYKDNAQFYCAIGDIKLDGENVSFIEMSDTIQIKDLNTFNTYIVTKPFNINTNSDLTFNIDYGVTDPLNATSMVKDKNQISYKVLLVESETNKVLMELENISFKEKQELKSKSKSFKINTNKIGSKKVLLKLFIEANFSPEVEKDLKFSLSHLFNEEYVLAKSLVEEVVLAETSVPLNYDLSQNYPNPFNPTTTITYQLPKDGIVTLKIYDALGSEVLTLVNEYKTTGKYNISFNAGNLASGVYFYKLNVNDYTSTKKLILMK